MNIRLSLYTLLATTILSGPAFAADITNEEFEQRLPAVSGPNGSLDFSYIHIDTGTPTGDIKGGFAAGSVTVPLSERFGLQIDAGIGRFDRSTGSSDIDSIGIAGHLFTRDPALGLLGVYGHFVKTDFGAIELNSVKYGIEAELYADKVSFEAFAGVDHIDAGAIERTSASLDFTMAYYATDNLRVEAGVTRQYDVTMGNVGFEAVIPQFENTSVYASSTFGDGDHSVRAGIRIYFGGGNKSLKDRHRQDDPKRRLVNFNGLNLGDFGEGMMENYDPKESCSEACTR